MEPAKKIRVKRILAKASGSVVSTSASMIPAATSLVPKVNNAKTVNVRAIYLVHMTPTVLAKAATSAGFPKAIWWRSSRK